MNDFNYKSDRRIKGGKSGVCPMCLHEKQLILSHVTPKWCYHWAKLEGNGSFVGFYPSIDRNAKIQDGNKHYMLCAECDQYLGDAENYMKFLMHGNPTEQQRIQIKRTIIDESYEIYNDVNIELIQRFMLGLALKSHYATSAPFNDIKLNESTLEKIRDRLFNPKIDDLDYPIIAMQFDSKLVEGIDPKAIMIPQYVNNNIFKESLSFLIAGWEWIVIFNEELTVSEKIILDNRLQVSGTLPVLKDDILEQRHINQGKSLSRRDRRKIQRNKRK